MPGVRIPLTMIMLSMFLLRSANAEELWSSVPLSAAPAELLKAAQSEPAPADADVEVLLEEWTYTFESDGRYHRSMREIRRYLTDGGVRAHTSVETEWSPLLEEPPSLRARVITPDGASHNLDAKTIAEVPAEGRYDDVLSDRKGLRAFLPGLKVGAVAEEEVIVRQSRPQFDRGFSGRFPLTRWTPTRKLRLVLDGPAQLPLRWTARGAQVTPEQIRQGDRVRLVIEVGPLKPPKDMEPYLPPDVSPYPEIVFSTGKSWAEVAAAYAALVEPQIDPKAAEALVRETVGDERDRQKVAAKLVAKVRDTVRYAGVMFGQAAIVPEKCAEILRTATATARTSRRY